MLLQAILAFFAIFFVWGMLTKLDRTVHAVGQIVPTAQLQVMSNLEGGIVQETLAKQARSYVPMIRLFASITTASGGDFDANQSAFNSLQVKVSRLEAQLAGRSPQFPATQDVAVTEQIGIERSLYLSRQLDLQGLTSAGQARLIQAERAVAEAEAMSMPRWRDRYAASPRCQRHRAASVIDPS